MPSKDRAKANKACAAWTKADRAFMKTYDTVRRMPWEPVPPEELIQAHEKRIQAELAKERQ